MSEVPVIHKNADYRPLGTNVAFSCHPECGEAFTLLLNAIMLLEAKVDFLSKGTQIDPNATRDERQG